MEIKSIDNTKFYLPLTLTTQSTSPKNSLPQKTKSEQIKEKWNSTSTSNKILAGAGVIVLVAGIIKGKSIAKLFKSQAIEQTTNQNIQILAKSNTNYKRQTPLYFPEPTREQLVKHYEELQEQQNTYAARLANEWTKHDKDKYREITDILVSVENQIRHKNYSVVFKKDISNFASDESFRKAQIHNYMHQFVYPKTNVNEASALDVLELFEQYGIKSESGRIGSTIFSLSLDLSRLPKNHKTERLFSKYLDLMEKIGEKDNYDDAHSVAITLTNFINTNNPNNIKEDSVLRAINMIKTFAQGDKKVKFVCNAILHSKYSENPQISDAVNELLLQIKIKNK